MNPFRESTREYCQQSELLFTESDIDALLADRTYLAELVDCDFSDRPEDEVERCELFTMIYNRLRSNPELPAATPEPELLAPLTVAQLIESLKTFDPTSTVVVAIQKHSEFLTEIRHFPDIDNQLVFLCAKMPAPIA